MISEGGCVAIFSIADEVSSGCVVIGYGDEARC